MITATLNAWATSMGVDQQTLERWLVNAGFNKPKSGWGDITYRKIEKAVLGDEQKEKIRNLKADADRKEREELERRGELVDKTEVEAWIVQKFIAPFSNILSSAPSTLDTRCNPERPEIARRAIEDWVENSAKPLLKTELEKLKV